MTCEHCSNKPVRVAIVLDRSGSMGNVQDKTIDGFNEYINGLRADEGNNYLVSLLQFDDQFETNFTNTPVKEVPALTRATYQPRGLTAMCDAIGKTIGELSNTPSDEKVLVIIMTDGQENASNEFSKATINELIQKKESEGNWTITFLGTDASCLKEARDLGIKVGNMMQYAKSDVNNTLRGLVLNTSALAASAEMQSSTYYSGGNAKDTPETK